MKHAFCLLLAMFLFCTAPYSVRAESDEALYHQAVQLLTNKDYANAQALFESLGAYAGSAALAVACVYGRADDAFKQANYAEVEALFASVIDFADAASRMRTSRNRQIQVGSHVLFGRLEQDDDLSNGPDPIEWIVLDRQDERVLVLAKYCLSHLNYWSNPSYDERLRMLWDTFDTTFKEWENSLERWALNTLFIHEAFTEQEQAAIPTITVRAEAHPEYPEFNPGSDTQDKLFILSLSEAETYLTNPEWRIPEGTPLLYALRATTTDCFCGWLLRVPEIT